MSVYTTLTLKEVQDFAAPYGLKAIDLIPIQGGIQNTNYFLVCEDQQYVLTVFEDMDEQAAGELVPVLEHLGQAGVAVPVPLSHSGKAIHSIKGKPAQIAPRMLGEHPMPATKAQAEAIAIAQAKMHVALKDFKLEREFVRDHAYWYAVAQEIKPTLNAADKVLLGKLLGLYEALTAVYTDRPRGFIHSDLFRDNTLFEGDQLNGILDFYELNKDELLFDIAITLNDFCTDYPAVTLNEERAVAFLKAYESIRPLTEDEKACLQLYLAMAAGRFWMMRLQVAQKNAAQGRTGNDILQKNPEEMRNMLIERLKFVTA
ncbi:MULTISPECIES: homoserine kinase [Acinetobacter]|jgi:homoserine kinase type II|uniref:homoserine kinase n=1 Tax=Acinetobacter TaxID=469 RepID=UPI000CDE06B8|nr:MULTISPECIES: homoserine kinase [Acinetobacter]MBB4834273.1 homoserine kinase type II [Acinetobacter schindleri]MEB5927860.1 homoserine kinase [Acinetobacter schindleri]POU27055.1 homoserine kinase [Acinetobacter sp. ACNIH3]POV78844.1 homoserine kinase [Acinetobacter sp. ACNIH4]RAZ03747.1 homoserine kinase [Acinetobacter sp. SM1B]